MIISQRVRGTSGMSDGSSHFLGYDLSGNTRLLTDSQAFVLDRYLTIALFVKIIK